jgi:hypothetical protein
MIVKVGVAPSSSRLAPPVEWDIGLGHALASASPFRKAASAEPDTSTHFGSGEASAS